MVLSAWHILEEKTNISRSNCGLHTLPLFVLARESAWSVQIDAYSLLTHELHWYQ